MSSTDELAKFNSLTKDERVMSSGRIRAKYPSKVPIVLHRSAGNTAVPELSRFRYLVPVDLRVSELITVIRRNIKDSEFDESKSLFLIIDNSVMPSSSQTVAELDQLYKNEDGFLYMNYSGENTFGA
ncbi:unnamed protein product [Oikopleura dioica]|uniref:Autophagy-related protein n=1 Tax=Oikopleura dioica TaxID=34765 RepID=E4YU28_OIKDI|nr:unnamed protein product [Oikopleura dioica]